MQIYVVVFVNNSMKKAVLISLFLVLVTSLWAQSSEWTEYCRLQKMVRYEELSSDSAYSIYYKMDLSIAEYHRI